MLDTVDNTNDQSLHNLNQDDCEPTAWVITGPISFCSQEQGTSVSAWIYRCVQKSGKLA